MWDLLAVYLPFMVLSLTGALSPGPLSTTAITEGARSGRWAGARLALGHGLVEVPVVFAIAYGLGAWLQQPIVRGVMGVAGAGVLVWMGYGLIAGAWQGRLRLEGPPVPQQGGSSAGLAPRMRHGAPNACPDVVQATECEGKSLSRQNARVVAGGAMLTLTNPYWSFWWVTVGAGRISAVTALQYGPLAIGGLALAHWLTDLGWLGGLSFVTASGRETIGDRLYRGVLLFCGVFLLAFGAYLGWNGAAFLLAPR